MSNEAKKQKFSERNRKKKKFSEPKTVRSIWVAAEGFLDETHKIKFEVNQDLADLSESFCERLDTLKGVKPEKLSFVRINDRFNLIPKDTTIDELSTSFADPIVIRYPLLDPGSVTVNCSLGRINFKPLKIRCSSGLWFHICKMVEIEWKNRGKAPDLKSIEYGFTWNKTDIWDDSQLISEIITNKLKEIKLNICFKDYKCYSDWKLQEALQVVGKKSITDFKSFKLGSTELSAKALESFKSELSRRKNSFRIIHKNEATTREFISPFLTTAVDYVNTVWKCKAHRGDSKAAIENDNCEKSHILQPDDWIIELKAEEELNGSKAYGKVDYLMVHKNCVVVVNEEKNNDGNEDVDLNGTVVKVKKKEENQEENQEDSERLIKQGLAQNLLQMHTAVEKWIKAFPDVPARICGIFTNGLHWKFLLWTGGLENPEIQKFEAEAEFQPPDFESEVKILQHLITFLMEEVNYVEEHTKK